RQRCRRSHLLYRCPLAPAAADDRARHPNGAHHARGHPPDGGRPQGSAVRRGVWLYPLPGRLSPHPLALLAPPRHPPHRLHSSRPVRPIEVTDVSVDGDHATPARPNAYPASFDTHITALTGDAAQLAAVPAQFRANYAKLAESNAASTPDHTVKSYLADQAGH